MRIRQTIFYAVLKRPFVRFVIKSAALLFDERSNNHKEHKDPFRQRIGLTPRNFFASKERTKDTEGFYFTLCALQVWEANRSDYFLSWIEKAL